jgi:hypothetical protein
MATLNPNFQPARAGSRISSTEYVTARSRARLAAMDAQIAAIPAQIETARARIGTRAHSLLENVQLLNTIPRIVTPQDPIPLEAGFIRVFIARQIIVVAQTGTQTTLPMGINDCLRRNFVDRWIIQWNINDDTMVTVFIAALDRDDTFGDIFEQAGDNIDMMKRRSLGRDGPEISVNEFISNYRHDLISYADVMRCLS